MRLTARNRLSSTITEIHRGEAVDELGLQVSSSATAIKASDVMIDVAD